MLMAIVRSDSSFVSVYRSQLPDKLIWRLMNHSVSCFPTCLVEFSISNC